MDQSHVLELVRQINFGHQALIDSIDEVSSAVPLGMQLTPQTYYGVKLKLRTLENRLFAHFSAHKAELFLKLKEKNIEDKTKIKLIDFIEHELKDIKVKSLIFFDAHPGDMGDIKPGNFIKDFHGFTTELVNFIKNEQQYLIPLIKEL